MRVRIRDISPEGLTLKEPLSAQSLNARMNEAPSNDIVFIEDPVVAVKVEKTTTGAQTSGEVSARFRQPCGLCLRDIERASTARADFIFQERKPRTERHGGRGGEEPQEDDIGVSYFEGEHIELEPLLQEALILTLDPYWHPPCGPDGRCSECGECGAHHSPSGGGEKGERVQGRTSLGDLLERAGIKTKG